MPISVCTGLTSDVERKEVDGQEDGKSSFKWAHLAGGIIYFLMKVLWIKTQDLGHAKHTVYQWAIPFPCPNFHQCGSQGPSLLGFSRFVITPTLLIFFVFFLSSPYLYFFPLWNIKKVLQKCKGVVLCFSQKIQVKILENNSFSLKRVRAMDRENTNGRMWWIPLLSRPHS